MRTMGFFVDPRIGIVQVPHTFYNHDPMQSNLALRKSLPDDQRFFFEAIMPARDAWNAAFCCGSNSVTRRSALKAAGDRLPTESITEDMLLTLKLLRKGYITRYLNERLAIGLAPESVEAFFIQRKRWARGAIQILYLRLGPLGPGLALLHRLFFLPTHWLSQSLLMIFGVLTPVVFLWTGMMPLVNVTPQAIVYMLLPSVLAITGGIWVLASKQYFPFAVQVIGLFQSIKLLPTILMTVIKPRGHIFKVTPKGAHAHGIRLDREVFWFAAVMIVLTLGGVLINASHDLRIIAQAGLLPVVAAWSLINVTILILVCMMAVQSAARRGEERFHIRETVQFLKPNGFLCSADVIDISLSGLAARVNADAMGGFTVSDHVCVAVSEVGIVRAHVVRLDDGKVHVKFDLPPSPERDLLVRKIFTSGFLSTPVEGNAWTVMFALLASILKAPSTTAEVVPKEPATPALLPSLPAATFVIHPPKDRLQWNTVSEDRRFVA